jgi:hypothetical protein
MSPSLTSGTKEKDFVKDRKWLVSGIGRGLNRKASEGTTGERIMVDRDHKQKRAGRRGESLSMVILKSPRGMKDGLGDSLVLNLPRPVRHSVPGVFPGSRG